MLTWTAVAKLAGNRRRKNDAPRPAQTRSSVTARPHNAGPRAAAEPRLLPSSATRADGLLRLCVSQSAKGAGFDEIYDEVLRPSALVGNGVATVAAEAGAIRKVPLRTGGTFIFDEATRQWHLDRRSSLLR